MSVTREAVEEAKALVAPHIVGAKHVRIRVVTLRRLLTALQAREEENEKLRSQRDALRQQSEVWALEARAHKSSLHEAYQAITGATGEPGNWNGAKPIIEHVTTLQSALAEALVALGKVAAPRRPGIRREPPSRSLAMSHELKRLEPGWLAKAIADAQRWYAANKEYADAVRANWIDHDRPASQEQGGSDHA